MSVHQKRPGKVIKTVVWRDRKGKFIRVRPYKGKR